MNRTERNSFIILLTYLMLPILMGVFLASDLSGIGVRLVYLLAGASFYALGLALFKRRTFFYVNMLMFIPCGVEMVHLLMNKATTSLLFVYTCLKAEPSEIVELFTTYWWILGIALCLWGTYFYLVRHYIQNEYLFSKRLRRGIVVGVLVLFLGGAIGLHFSNNPIQWLPIHREETRTTSLVGMEKACPFNQVLALYHITNLYIDLQHSEAQLAGFHFEATSPDQDSTLVVLIIGETSRYDHWQLYGYSRPTSPKLMQRKQELLCFDSCYSIANLTTISVPFMVSAATPEQVHRLYCEKSVVEAFGEAGYRTAWLADQSFGNIFLQRIASTCDRSYYQPHQEGQRDYVDSVLFCPLDEELQQDGKQMIVLHTMGCHFKYSSRYPDEYSVYQPDMKNIDPKEIIEDMNHEGRLIRDKVALKQVRTIFVNSYDNAILYTDYFLDAVITRVEATHRKAIVLYVADHGENLLDDERNMLMHGTYAGSKYEYHVPLFIWMSPSYQQEHNDQVQALQQHLHTPFTTMSVFHTLLDLGTIQTSYLDSTMVLSQPTLVKREKLIGLDANLKCMEIEK